MTSDNGEAQVGAAVVVQVVLDMGTGQTQFSYNTDNLILVLQMLQSAMLEAQCRYMKKRLEPEPPRIVVPSVVLPKELDKVS